MFEKKIRLKPQTTDKFLPKKPQLFFFSVIVQLELSTVLQKKVQLFEFFKFLPEQLNS